MAKKKSDKAKGSRDDSNEKLIAQNRKARFEYEVLETLECGIMLVGSEVKSIRNGRLSLDESYARMDKGEVWLVGCDIQEYTNANVLNHDPHVFPAHEVERLVRRGRFQASDTMQIQQDDQRRPHRRLVVHHYNVSHVALEARPARPRRQARAASMAERAVRVIIAAVGRARDRLGMIICFRFCQGSSRNGTQPAEGSMRKRIPNSRNRSVPIQNAGTACPN